jgi:hypothetical protein
MNKRVNEEYEMLLNNIFLRLLHVSAAKKIFIVFSLNPN